MVFKVGKKLNQANRFKSTAEFGDIETINKGSFKAKLLCLVARWCIKVGARFLSYTAKRDWIVQAKNHNDLSLK